MRAVAVFFLLLAIWFFWSGHTEPLLLGLGVFSCALVAWFAHRMDVLDRESFPFHLWFGLVTYVPWVLWQVIISNIDVARVILDPKMPIHSHLFRIKLTPKTELGRVILANTITITPGTVSVHLKDDEVIVHGLTKEAAEGDASGELNRRVSALEKV